MGPGFADGVPARPLPLGSPVPPRGLPLSRMLLGPRRVPRTELLASAPLCLRARPVCSGCYRQAPPTRSAQGPLAATNTLSRTRSLTVPRPPFDHLHPAAPSPWPQSQTLLVGATLQAASPWSACRPAWATQPPQVMRGPRAGGRAAHIPRPPATASRTPGPGAAGAGGGSGHPALSF